MGIWLTQPEPETDETIRWHSSAGRSLSGWVMSGGQLIVTTQCVLFQSNRFDRLTGNKHGNVRSLPQLESKQLTVTSQCSQAEYASASRFTPLTIMRSSSSIFLTRGWKTSKISSPGVCNEIEDRLAGRELIGRLSSPGTMIGPR